MEVKLKRISAVKFEAKNASGQSTIIDGPPAMGGTESGVRPMEMLLMSLAGCSSMDVVHILNKSRKQLDSLEISVKADRADATPAVFTDIHMHFDASGDFNLEKLEKTVALSVEKYCSAVATLAPSVKVTHSCKLI